MFSFILLQASIFGNGMIGQFVMIGGIMIVFYFFMLRPQQKKTKDQKLFRESLKRGDKVVTIGGEHGVIVDITESTVTLDVDRGVKITYERTSISDELTKKYQAAPVKA